jgi:hypothetical protein
MGMTGADGGCVAHRSIDDHATAAALDSLGAEKWSM